MPINIDYSEQQSKCGQPIYECPPSKYSSEKILQILLDPKIPMDKICTAKPRGITSSATLVVDIRQLKCMDDVKKDEFGIWKYSGSHPTAYEVTVHKDFVEVEKCHDDSHEDNIVHLRRLRCVHPSNQEFKRMICFVSGMSSVLSIVLIHDSITCIN